MLPDGFRWAIRHQYDTRHTALTLDGKQVAMLLERVDDSWFAVLDAHKGVHAPLVRRDCTSFEAGKAGIEAWACRHEARIRAEAGR
jgi:hypothetical protein